MLLTEGKKKKLLLPETFTHTKLILLYQLEHGDHPLYNRTAHAKKAVEAGYYFSVPPSVIRSPHFQKLVTEIPLSNLLLESDSPALGPEKAVDNEPANIALSAQEIARIKGISIEEVVRVYDD